MQGLTNRALGALHAGFRRRWCDLFLLAGGLQALFWMAHPDELTALSGSRALGHDAAFEVATALALGAFAVLSLRTLAVLYGTMRKLSWGPAPRAERGTVMAEFALVLPVVLLMLGTVFQVALVANAALVVRYAAFTAARSAIVSFEADISDFSGMLQFRPLPEWVDTDRPTTAASLVLASISPKLSGSDSSEASRALAEALIVNDDGWEGADFSDRAAYAKQAMDLFIKSDYFDSLPPLIPLPEHAVQPGRARLVSPAERENLGYTLPKPPKLETLIPPEVEVELFKPPPAAEEIASAIGLPLDNLNISISIPLDEVKRTAQPVLDKFDKGLEELRQGQGRVVRLFARSPINIDAFGPKEVEVTLEYRFKLNLPSILHLVPDRLGLTTEAPGGGRAFLIRQSEAERTIGGSRVTEPGDYTVRLQSMGGRSNPLGTIPLLPTLSASTFQPALVSNTPLYFRLRQGAATQPQQPQPSAPPPPPDPPTGRTRGRRNAISGPAGGGPAGGGPAGGGPP